MYGSTRVRCPWCDKSHEAPAHLAGKKVRCKNCTGVIKIPGEAVAGPTPAPPPPTPTPSRPLARAAVARVSTRVEPTPPPPADLFDLDEAPPPPRRPPTLRELEDGGYDEGPLPERVTVGLPPREEADGKPGKGRKRKKRRGQGGESSTWERVQTGLLVVGLLGCLMILGLGLFVPGGRSIAVLLSFVAGLGMMMVGGIWSACVPFQESTRCGLMYLFVPFYAGYYTKTRFSEMFTPFLVNLSGGFLVYMATLGPLNQQGVEPGRGAQPVELGEEFEGGGWDEDEEVDQVEVGTNAMNPDAAGDVAAPPSLPPGSGGRRGRDDR